jgi:hypothetical protein
LGPTDAVLDDLSHRRQAAETSNESGGLLNRAVREGQGFSAPEDPGDLRFAFLKNHMVLIEIMVSGAGTGISSAAGEPGFVSSGVELDLCRKTFKNRRGG